MPIGTWSARERNIINEYGYSSESDAEVEEKQVEEERSRSRPKSRRSRGGRGGGYPRPHSHLLRSVDGRRARGSRHTRRFENSAYLRTLYQIPKEELADDYLLVVPEHDSPFKELFTDNKQRQIWQKFVKLSEEQQQSILSGKRSDQKKPVPGEKKSKPSELKSLERMDRNIRIVLHSRRTPHDFLDSLEAEMRDLFIADSALVHVLLQPSSYHRMLTHGVCQYLGLSSKTERDGDTTLVVINSTRCLFEPPPTFLTAHL